ncbi:MAG: transporter [Paenisporosarcina sp.]|nr:transporter [Paenisporosarcina sp.]
MVNQFPGFPFSDRNFPSLGIPGFPGQGGPQFGIPGFPGQGGPPSGRPGFPGPGGPPQGPGFPSLPGGVRPSSNAPSGPPPSFVPQQASQTRAGTSLYAVDPGAIRGCLYRYTYIWLRNHRAFWFYPTYVGRESIAGYRWNGYRWNYYGTDLERISSFQCF